MVGLAALWMPIVVSAVFVFIALMIIHMMPGWHKGDMTAVPGEDKVRETLRGLKVQPGDYRFPFSNSVTEMESPAFKEKMKQGPVGNMSILPSGDISLMVNLHEDEFRTYDDQGRVRRVRGAMLAGPRAGHTVIDTAEQRCMVAVSFTPGGASALFAMPLSEACLSISDWLRSPRRSV